MGFKRKLLSLTSKKAIGELCEASAEHKRPIAFFGGAVLPPFLSMRDAPQAVSIVDEEAENSSANCQKDF